MHVLSVRPGVTSARMAMTLLMLAGCAACPRGGNGQDAGEPHSDASLPPTDAGGTTTDGGGLIGDAGAAVNDGGPADAGLPGTCLDTQLPGCVYPSRGLPFGVRRGLHATEPVTGRSLNLTARIPAGGGPHPVVIFSHGGGFDDSGQELSATWGETFAAHGFVAINVGHVSMTSQGGLAMCARVGVPQAECAGGDDDETGLLGVFRAHDLKAVLDALPGLSALSVDGGGPALDLDRIALAGWSGGARGPQVLQGVVTRPSASAPLFSMPDARVKAMIALSPAGVPYAGYFAPEDGGISSWSSERAPTLVATGNNDVKPDKPALVGAIRRQAFDRQPRDGNRWMLYSNLAVGVGGHGTYNLGDLESSDERLRRLSLAIRSVALAFLDAFLRDSTLARAWLDSTRARTLAGEAEWAYR